MQHGPPAGQTGPSIDSTESKGAMMTTTIRESFWEATAEVPEFAPLDGAANADVAIIGGGMVGMTLADLLKRAGHSVAVIESHRVGTQVTGRSTAKLTALQGVTYRRLIAEQGVEVAQAYAQANQQAIDALAARVGEAGFDCNLRREPAYTCAIDAGRMDTLREEAEAAKQAGLDVELVEEAPLPFPIAGAVKLDHQLAFHPTRYVVGLARLVDGDGSRVYGRTRALDVDEGNPCRVVTDRGTVTARHVVVATHLPILDRGLFFTKAFPRRHSVLAAAIPEEQAPGGMFLGIDKPTWSVRTFRDGDDASPVLIATGAADRPSHGDAAKSAERLERFARERFGATEIRNSWINEDYDSMDRLPFVGRMPGADRVWLATGFSAWGLTNGTAAARLLADLIEGRRNPLAEQWDARRWRLKAGGKTFLTKNLHAGQELIMERVRGLRAPSAEHLARGEGGIVRHHGKLVAAYRDDDGNLATYSPYCTHLYCVLGWEAPDKVFSCSCHGSIFDHEGRVLHGPAVRDLRRFD
jgi:glycine/D-amino acid oxidase-like deaminating enzyme/nitrite reductase/ring-hydroxylating ferredoxin subunit